MPKKVKVLVLRTAGTNCNEETAFAFERVGAEVDQIHINRLIAGEIKLADYHILALPGGFSYGDDIASGRILANELKVKLGEEIKKFIHDGKLILGICNGFQILTKAGFLPGFSLDNGIQQEATLTTNDSARFEDRWIHLKVSGNSIWIKNLPETIYLPVAHGEGKFIPRDEAILKRIQKNGLVALRYVSEGQAKVEYPENPNGAVDNIAGITDATGRVLGLMPHPERHFLFTQHPFWTRLSKKNEFGVGAKIFENGVSYVRQNLL